MTRQPTAGFGRGRPRGGRVLLVIGWSACGLVVVVAALAQVVRPLAPDLGPPVAPTRFFPPELVRLSAEYRAPLRLAGIVALTAGVAVPAVFAWTRAGRRVVDRIAALAGRRRALAGGAIALTIAVSTDVLLLPQAFALGFVREGVYGFRSQGLAGWARDWIVLRAPGWAAAAGAVAAALWLARRLPRGWPVALGLGGAALSLLFLAVAPLVLEPLVFSTTPLPPGPVRQEVEQVLADAGAPDSALLVADASRRSTRENAYVSGVGSTRRVVLFDTLVSNRTPAEIGLVVAHELGHQAHGDLVRSALLGAGGAVGLAVVLGVVVRHRVRRGVADGADDPRAVAALLAVVALLQLASLPVQTLISRRAEAAADLAALQLTGDPATFAEQQRGLARANLTDLDPPRWAHLLWGTHPTPPQRLEMAARYAEERT